MTLPFRNPETPLTFEQLELRKQVLKQVENEPDSFDMNSWEQVFSDGEREIYQSDGRTRTVCGTTRCLGGWAIHFAGESSRNIDAPRNRGIKLLGLTPDEYFIPGVGGLFYTSDTIAVEHFREITEHPENPGA